VCIQVSYDGPARSLSSPDPENADVPRQRPPTSLYMALIVRSTEVEEARGVGIREEDFHRRFLQFKKRRGIRGLHNAGAGSPSSRVTPAAPAKRFLEIPTLTSASPSVSSESAIVVYFFKSHIFAERVWRAPAIERCGFCISFLFLLLFL
jgi:hypothetical protein